MTYFGESPDQDLVDAWNDTYLSHRRDPQDPTQCAMPDCPSRFPCALRLDAAELLILAGIGVPPRPKLCAEKDDFCRIMPPTAGKLPAARNRTSPSTRKITVSAAASRIGSVAA